MEEKTYLDGVSLIGSGIAVIARRLPRTFANSVSLLVRNHYLFLVFIFSIIAYQFVCNANLKMERDSASRKLYEYEAKQDSLTRTTYKYVSYDKNV